MKIGNFIHKAGFVCALMTAPAVFANTLSRVPQNDTFIKTETVITPEGTSDKSVLANAPEPYITIAGVKKTAKFIVDISKNVLYKYNAEGRAEIAYLIASGKKNTPTDKGIRVVTHTETYPYRTAPRHTKRRRNPRAYGPRVICLNKIDTITGEQSQTGEFIHGTNQPNSIGKYISLGCMRMDNDVIKKLADEVKRGDIVIIK